LKPSYRIREPGDDLESLLAALDIVEERLAVAVAQWNSMAQADCIPLLHHIAMLNVIASCLHRQIGQAFDLMANCPSSSRPN
jgi:hypothetical protein